MNGTSPYPGLCGQPLPAMPWDSQDDEDRSILIMLHWCTAGAAVLASLGWWSVDIDAGQSDADVFAVVTSGLAVTGMLLQAWAALVIRRSVRERYAVWLERHLAEVWQ